MTTTDPLQRWLHWDSRLSAEIARAAAFESAPWRRKAALWLAHTGDAWVILSAGGLLWLRGAPRLGLRILVITAVAGLLSSLVKAVFRRARPHTRNQALYLGPDRYSFPSGHAARLGGLLAVAGSALPLWGGALLALWALGVCLTRIALRVHYLSDIAAGLALGWATGALLICL